MSTPNEIPPPGDYTHARTGMWLFLITEIFAAWGFFLVYAEYRAQFPEDFQFAGNTLEILPGLLTTIVLITCSFTVNLATLYLQRKNRETSAWFLAISVLLGLGFLIIKFFEWFAKIDKGLFPGSKILQTHPPGENIFYRMYYLVTGFHGLLVLAVTIVLAALLFHVWRNHGDGNNVGTLDTMTKMENTALLWHTLVVLWIFIFPLFYLLT